MPHRRHTKDAEPTTLWPQAACSSRADDASSAPMGLESGQQPSGQSTRGSIQPHLPVGRQLRPLLFEVQVRWSQGCCNDPQLRLLPEDAWSFATRDAPRQVPENAPESSVARRILNRVGEGALGVASAPVAATSGLSRCYACTHMGDDGPNA